MQTVKKHLLVTCGSVAVAAIAALGIYRLAVGGNQKMPVVVAKSTIQAGQTITGNDIEMGGRTKSDLQAGAKNKLSAVVGQKAVGTIYAGDTITDQKIAKSENAVPDGKMEMSVPVKNFAAGLSGGLQAGDIVSISAVPATVGASVPALPNLQYVKVLSVYPAQGASKTSSSANSSGSTVTLLVTGQQFATLTSYDSGTLHFALVSRGNAKTAAELLSSQDQNNSASSEQTASTSSAVTQ